MAERRPSFPFYPKDWLASASVSAMPLAAQGLYVRLMAYAWQADGLPCSDELLRNLVGVSRAEWRKLWPHVQPMWRKENGRLFNRKLEQVRAESAAFSEAKRVAGRASAAAKHQQNVNRTATDRQQKASTPATDGATESQPAFASAFASTTAVQTHTPARVVDAQWGPMQTRRKAHCAYESAIGLDVPQFLHDEFLARLVNAGTPNADAALHAWYGATEQAYTGKAVGDEGVKFWRARFAEWQGRSAKAAPTSAAALVDYTPSKFRGVSA